jgi:uncharacterized repeat protein (TIGR03803 family)
MPQLNRDMLPAASEAIQMSPSKFPARLRIALTIAAVVISVSTASAGGKEHVLHSFGLGSDGIAPSSDLIADGSGNFYGTTAGGGAHGLGTVFKLTPNPPSGWKETILYSFKGGTDGLGPSGGLTWDSQGNLYGTTAGGGKIGQGCQGNTGCGVVYELSPQSGGKWQEKVLYRFKRCGKDGCRPTAGLVFDSLGNLFGTTFYGGSFVCGKMGCGTVFELTHTSDGWQETIVYPFKAGHTDGSHPEAGLVVDMAGNLWGTTTFGGASGCPNGCGTVFELTQASGGWTEAVIHNFTGSDGARPYASLTLDATTGVFYGTTGAGGSGEFGTVFQLAPGSGGSWTENVLYSFSTGSPNGSQPAANVITDANGNLFGTTTKDGSVTCNCGTVFKLAPASQGTWTLNVLHKFFGGIDGANPDTGLLLDSAGSLFGTTFAGGNHNSSGTVFEITP